MIIETPLFSDESISSFEKKKIQSLSDEINNEEENYILNVGQEQYINHLYEKHKFESLTILDEEVTTQIKEESIFGASFPSRLYNVEPNKLYKKDVAYFYVPFLGEKKYIRLQPTTFSTSSIRGTINENELIFSIIIFNQSREEIIEEFEDSLEQLKETVRRLNNDIENYNSKLQSIIKEKFIGRKEKILKRRELEASFKIPIKKKDNIPTTFSILAPKIKKKINIKPNVGLQPFEPEPTLDESTYFDILNVINDMGKAFERKPSVYSNKGEEDLRDHFLMLLEPNYEGSATGETFNKTGKTDILLRHDGNNAFVGECKFWKGEKSFLSTIDQLLGYLTWRDSKTAVIMFVKNKDFTQTLNVAKSAIKNHKNYVRFNGEQDETWLNYTFNLPGDPNKEIQLALMMYHTVDVD
ncbi:hypothetical protein MOB93_18000 [Bacillus inaquosorum]|uniref:hypothetical protein n=1 Tax=Bacillus inaquosorum TaxID=483913 RepID=UPI0022812528|nr:hypothetical protein [Bacillus inaquosorum]MCY7943917.1 hypothetical protein [Bacillus inaquosorum]